MVARAVVGSTILVAWLIFSMWAGMQILDRHGEAIGELFAVYLLALVGVIMAGRFVIGWLFDKLWKKS